MKAASYTWMLTALLGVVQPFADGLVVPEPHVVLGERYIGEQIEVVYDLENPGDQPFLISRVELGCSACQRVELSGKTVAPGELEVLSVFFDSTTFIGPVSQFVIVHPFDVAQKPIKLSFSTRLRPPFDVAPKLPAIELTPGVPSVAEFTIRPHRPMEGGIKAVVPTNPELLVELEPIENDPAARRCVVRWDGKQLPRGPHTDIEIIPELTRDLNGIFKLAHHFPGRVEIQPDIVYFEAQRGIQKRLMIITQDPRTSMELVSIKVPPKLFRYEVSPVRGKPDYEIYLYGRGLDTLKTNEVEIEFNFRGEKGQVFTARHQLTLL